jgi:hypothetical protein
VTYYTRIPDRFGVINEKQFIHGMNIDASVYYKPISGAYNRRLMYLLDVNGKIIEKLGEVKSIKEPIFELPCRLENRQRHGQKGWLH